MPYPGPTFCLARGTTFHFRSSIVPQLHSPQSPVMESPEYFAFDHLPQEIQNGIFSCITPTWSHSDLHNIRLVNHSFNIAITPILLHTLHLSRNNLSLDRLVKVYESPTLARHVRSIFFDRRVWHFNLQEESQVTFPSFCDTLRFDLAKCWPDEFPRPSRRVKDILKGIPPEQLQTWYEAAVAESIADQEARHDVDWTASLPAIFHQFPNLESMELTHYEDRTQNTEFVQRRTGLTGMNSVHFNLFIFSDLIKLAVQSGKKLKSLSLSHIHPPDILEVEGELEILKTVENLRFKLDHNFISNEETNASAALLLLLKACTQLKSLALEFCQRCNAEKQQLYSISEAITKHPMPYLQELELASLNMDQEPFLEFLEAHNGTLRSLRLCNWWIEGNPEDIIQAFWKIPQVNTLSHVTLEGRFQTRKDQDFHGWEAVNRQSIKTKLLPGEDVLSRLETFLCRRGPFPFSDTVKEMLGDQLLDTFSTGVLNDTDALDISEDATWKWQASKDGLPVTRRRKRKAGKA